MKLSELIRWTVISATGGYGLNCLVEICAGVIAWLAADAGAMPLILFIATNVLLAAVCLSISLYAFLRQDRNVTIIVIGLMSVAVCGWLMSLPEQLGVSESLRSRDPEQEWLLPILLPVSIICLVGPFYGAVWFFRLCLWAANRWLFRRPPIAASSRQADSPNQVHRASL